MKVIDNTNLGHLWQRIGTFFWKKTDVNVLPIDSTPTSASNNLVTSDGVYNALGTKESVSNKVTSISSASTDTQYPSAKCVYDAISDLSIISGTGVSAIVALTESEYAALEAKDSTTLYIVTPDPEPEPGGGW